MGYGQARASRFLLVGTKTQAGIASFCQRADGVGIRCPPTQGLPAERFSLVSAMEEGWCRRTQGRRAGGPQTAPECTPAQAIGNRLAARRRRAWVQRRALDAVASDGGDSTNHWREVSSGPCLEDSRIDQLERAKAGAASQGAEPGNSGLLEERALAGGKKNAARQQAWIFFHDESGFTQQPSVRTSWAPRGKTPILRPRGNHWSKTSVAAALGFRWDGAKTRLLAAPSQTATTPQP